MKIQMKSAIACAAVVSVFGMGDLAWSVPTRVGNGDDGGDLEKGTPVKTGILVEARDEAVALLKKLNVSGVENLGGLGPELETAPIILIGKDITVNSLSATPEEIAKAKEEAKAIGAVTDDDRTVYARTFPEPHAATRFFPAALLLDRKQLVALHVHEALHRALPEDLREDEKAVSRLTLAIGSDGASFDRVASAMAQIKSQRAAAAVPASAPASTRVGASASNGQPNGLESRADEAALNAEARAELGLGQKERLVKQPSTFEYGYRSYLSVDPARSSAPVEGMHSLKSLLYPFGHKAGALGVGIEMTFLRLPEESYLGPLGLSGRLRLATWRDFDVDMLAAFHLNTVAASEFKGTPMARDTMTAGLAVRRDERRFRIENQLYWTAGSESSQKIGRIDYTHTYGSIIAARVSAAAKMPFGGDYSFDFGGTGEVLLANPYSVKGGSFEYHSDRTRVVSVGPEVGITAGDFRVSAFGHYVIDSTNKVSLDQLGDLLGQGVGQGSVGGALTWKF